MSFEEASTIPLVSLTAAISLYRRQGLPEPWAPRSSSSEPLPLIVYGASSALGTYAVKLAKLSNIHPIIAICGGSSQYVEKFLDKEKGDAIVDYRQGPEQMLLAVQNALGGLKARHGLDAISANGTWLPLAKMVDPTGSQISVVSGANKYDEAEIPAGVQMKYTYVGTAHYGAYKPTMPKQPEDKDFVKKDIDFAYVFVRYLSRALALGTFEGHPVEIVPGGLAGVETGLNNLKAGKAKGVKYVYRVGETA